MAAITFRRPARREPPPLVIEQVEVRPAPALPERRPGDVSNWWLVVPVLAGLAALALIFSAGGSAVQVAAAVLFGISALAIVGSQLARVGGDRTRRIAGQRRDYLRHLAYIRRRARSAAADQAAALLWLHPEPRGLQSLVRTSRLWERRPTDADFATVRMGLGDQALALDVQLSESEQPGADVLSAVALRRLLRVQGTVRGLPIVLSLRSFGRVRIEGNPIVARRMATAMVLQAISWHAPTELRIALCADDAGVRAWDWLKWAPHVADQSAGPTDLPRFAVAKYLSDLDEMLADELAGRKAALPGSATTPGRSHLLVIVDGGSVGDSSVGRSRRLADAGGLLGVTVLDVTASLADRSITRSLRLQVTDEDVFQVAEDSAGQLVLSRIGAPDQLEAAEAAATCRTIAGIRMPDSGDADQPLMSSTGLTDLLGVANIKTLTPSASWRPRPPRDLLRVPIGVGTSGQAVELDIKPAALGGMGPHGLMVGAPGSGKSELLRTLVLGLAVTHSPDLLNFVLVDVKGDGTFATLDGLPHTSATITALSGQLDLIDRLKAAIGGELNRRMALLRSAGNVASQQDYDRARVLGGADMPAIPALLIVVDECSDLLAVKPDFLDVLVTVGRVGPSLGVHLLLATQQVDEGGLHGLDTYLSYRIGLKASSITQSRTVLDAPDAFELPTAPGNGFLKFDSTGLVRFKSAFVSGPVRDPRVGADDHEWVDPQAFRLTPQQGSRPLVSTPAGNAVSRQANQAPAGQAARAIAGKPNQATQGPTLLEVAVSRLSGSGVPAHEVWLPPLADPPSLDLLLPRASVRPVDSTVGDLSQRSETAPATSFLQVPLGWVDRPYDQNRDLLTIDLSGAAGHVAIVGAPGSGKSTAVRSLICALALTHTPEELQVYCLDLGDGGLAGLTGLPHVGAIASRRHPELTWRIVEMVGRLMKHRVTGPVRTAAGDGYDDGFGDVLLVVDGWSAVPDLPTPLDATLELLADRGLSCGIHLVIAADRWSDLPPTLMDRIGTRLELRLGNPLESVVSPELAATVPQNRPGRGLSQSRLHLLTAVPRIDGRPTGDGLATATAELVTAVADRWPGRSAPPVTLLPATVRPSDLPVILDPALGYPIGLDEDREPVFWNPRTDQHLLILGDKQSGKTTVLRRLIRQIADRGGPDAARFIVLDPDGQLLTLVDRPEQLIGSATSGPDAAALVGASVVRLRTRLAGPSMTGQDIDGRRWWGSPADIFVIVDDDEQLTDDPLAALIPLLDRAPDLALHVIVARRTRNASRADLDGIHAALLDVGATALVLSGADSQGPSDGRTAAVGPQPGRGVWVPRRGPELTVQTILDAQEW